MMANVPQGTAYAARYFLQGPVLMALKRLQLQQRHQGQIVQVRRARGCYRSPTWLMRTLDRAVGPAAPAVCLAAPCWPDGLDVKAHVCTVM